MSAATLVRVTLSLPEPQAIALAQFVKRIGYTEIQDQATDNYEADLMRDALEKLRRSLADEGFAPR